WDRGCGTPGFMPPEQYRGSIEIDPRTDVFALGVTLHRLVTGTALFHSDAGDVREDGAEIYRQMIDENYRPLFKPDGPISRELAAVIEQAIRSEPKRRFGSAREMSDALAKVPSVRAWRDGATDPAESERVGRPVLAAAVVLSTVIVVAALALVMFF